MDKVTQNNAATAEESAAAAQELNAQAEVMKQSVTNLLQLVGGESATAERKPAAYTQHPQPVPANQSAATRCVPATHNGNGAPALSSSSHRKEIPMDGDFKDF
jgi:methyl-accepting chemotaxis protein